MKWLKEKSTEFYKLSFEGGKLLLREMVTMLTSRGVIHRISGSF